MAWFSSLDATVQVAVITICGSVSVAIITGIFGLIKLHAALHACTTMNENQVQQTRQHDKI